MIRPKMQSDLRSILGSNKNFQPEDFSVTESVGLITITYEYDKRYLFEFQLPRSIAVVRGPSPIDAITKNILSIQSALNDGYTYQVKSVPGKLLSEEEFRAEGTQVLYESIKGWLTYLWQDLVAVPIDREFKRQQEDIENLKERIETLTNEDFDKFFTKDEAAKLSKKLDDLEKLFTDRIKESSEIKESDEKPIEAVQVQISNLKKMIPVLNKKNWLKLYSVRMFNWLLKEENRKFLKDAVDVVGPLLPEEAKALLPPEQH